MKIKEETKIIQTVYLTEDEFSSLMDVADLLDKFKDSPKLDDILESILEKETYKKLFEENEGNTYYVLKLIIDFIDNLRDNSKIDKEGEEEI